MSFNSSDIIKGIDLKINNSDFLIITGESGSGKTTLLSLLSTLEKPTEGQVLYEDIDIYSLHDKDLSKLRKKYVGIVFQRFYLEDEYTVLENVLLPLQFEKIKKEEKISRAKDVLEKCHILEKINEKTKNLSGGEMQRVAIARSLIHNPIFIFADEPCGNLDSKNGIIIMDLFKKLNVEENKTIVLVTHNKEHIKYGNRTIKLKDGVIIEDK